jgi:nucleoside 2-deoxyribosyltransferase
MNICLVGSMRDYARIQEIGRTLERQGHVTTIPIDMSEARFGDRKQAKATFMRQMFENIRGCDAVLAVNDRPRGGVQGYIGPNTYLQLGMGMSLGKPLFSLAKWDANLPYNEELEAMGIGQLDVKLPF